jgi:aminoglycoside N3'-acetyltransferase
LRGNIQEQVMSQIDDIKANAEEIRKGLRKLGANRAVALSVHKSKELIAELEEKAEKLVQQLENVN